MAVSVRVEDEAFSDMRYEVLGGLLGTSKYDALGRLCWLWRQCTQQSTYVLDQQVVQVVVDPEKLCVSRLGEFVADGVRIKGTEGRIEWLEEKKNAKVTAGKARARGAKRGPDGAFLPQQPLDSAGPSRPSRAPAGSSAPAPAPAPAPAIEHPPTPRGGKVVVPDSEIAAFLGQFKAHFGKARICEVKAYRELYRTARKAKYSADEIRAASWAASRMDAEVRDNCTPKTILRLRVKEGNTLSQWLEKANELWAQDRPDEPPPWEATDAQLNM